jgi:hypothetical protein
VWKPAPWAVGAFSLACLVSSAHAPKLVTFGDTGIVAQASATADPTHTMSYAPPSLAAPVIPASYKETHKQVRRNAANVATSGGRRAKSEVAQNRTSVRAVQTTPTVIRASAPVSPEPALPQQAVFVLMEGQQFGDAGPVVLRVTVWRLTVDANGSPQVVQETFARSI